MGMRIFLSEYSDTLQSPWSAKTNDYVYPPDNFVVAVTDAGVPITFADDVWTIRRDTSISRSNIIHLKDKGEPSGALSAKNLAQSKSILIAIDRHAYKNTFAPLGVASINRYNFALRMARRYCHEHGIAVYEALSSNEYVNAIHNYGLHQSPCNAESLKDLLNKLSLLPFRYVGFKPACVKDLPGGLARTNGNQTTVIPTSIYLGLMLNYKQKVDGYLQYSKQLESLALALSNDSNYGRGYTASEESAFKAALAVEGLADYAVENNISDVNALLCHFSLINYCSIMMIYAFSGMRRSEAYTLRLDSLQRTVKKGVVTARCLKGYTTKFHGRKKIVSWYSSVDIELPFDAACRVCNTILRCNGILPVRQYVFISTSYFPFSMFKFDAQTIDTEDVVAGNYMPSQYEFRLDTPVIRLCDLAEMKSVDPLRHWEAEPKYSINSRWPLRIHQLRRSTAVYAIRSGIVTLPALKMMLKHITIEMSKYYSKGSIYAPDLLKVFDNRKDSIVSIYQASERYVAAWQYTNEILMPEEILFGAHGKWVGSRVNDKLRAMNYAERFEETLKRVKKGQLSYRPTPVGGCTSSGVCTKRISVDLLGCENCASAVIRVPKLIKLIDLQKISVTSCLEGSIERNAEMQTLHELVGFASRIGALQ